MPSLLQNGGGGAAQTLYCPVFNDHRFFASYAWIYRTCLIFIPTLFTPLTYLGYNVYRMNWMLKRRSKMENRPKNQDKKTRTIKRNTAKVCRVRFSSFALF